MHTGRTGQARMIVMDEEILRLLMSGLTLKEISVHLGCHYATAMNHARRPEFLLKLKDLSGEIYKRVDEEMMNKKANIMARLEEASEIALEEMIALVQESKDPNMKFKAAQDLMDRNSQSSRSR